MIDLDVSYKSTKMDNITKTYLKHKQDTKHTGIRTKKESWQNNNTC